MSDPAIAPASLEEARDRIESVYKRARERAPQLGGLINSGTTISYIDSTRITWAFFFPNHVDVFTRHPWLMEAFSAVVAEEFGPQYALTLECNPDAVNVHCFHALVPAEAAELPVVTMAPVVTSPVLVADDVSPARRRRRKVQSEGFDYQRYLASREWSLLREEVRKRSRNICEHCHHAPQQAVHHTTYERIGNEDLADLMAICNPCHEWLSGKTSINPRSVHYRVSPATRQASGLTYHSLWPFSVEALADLFESDGLWSPTCYGPSCLWCKEVDSDWHKAFESCRRLYQLITKDPV